MRLYVAIDLHSNNNVLVILNEEDHVVYEKRLANDLDLIVSQLAPYESDIEAVALESTYNWYWLGDGLMAAGYEVKLVNTVEVKTYDGLKYSGDEHDARHLAHLLRLGLLPTGHIYPKGERAVRDLLRKRGHLVQGRTSQILSIENLVIRNSGRRIKTASVRAMDEQTASELCGGDWALTKAIMASQGVLKSFDTAIKGIERAVLAQARLKPEFKRLLGVDGIGEILAMTIMYETGNVERFAKAGNFASYARCVESGRWSNGKKKGEGNRKNGNKYLAWAFIEAAHAAIRYNERVKRFYQRKKARTNGIVAIKAVAHKLARASYRVLRDGTNFEVERAFA